jgi:hypothetical protein
MREQIRKLIDEELQFIDAIPDCDDFVDEKSARKYFVRKVESAIRPQWVPVSERLPDDGLECFVAIGDKTRIGYWCRTRGIWLSVDTGDLLTNVTHWHAIDYPQPPLVPRIQETGRSLLPTATALESYADLSLAKWSGCAPYVMG